MLGSVIPVKLVTLVGLSAMVACGGTEDQVGTPTATATPTPRPGSPAIGRPP